jgi:hypothetical protein
MPTDTDLDLSTKRFLLPPMHREGRRFVFAAALLTLVMTVAWTPLFWPGLLLTYGVFLFFRDPERVPPLDAQTAVLSPADGIVCLLMQVPLPAALAADSQPVWRVSVFMSVLDVHVNRMPVAATVQRMHYIPGAFLNASLDKASEDNERMLYSFKYGLRPYARRGPDRGIDRAPDRHFRQRGPSLGHRRTVRFDPVRQPCGRLPPGRRRALCARRSDHGRRRAPIAHL